MNLSDKWKLAIAAYNGSGGFADGSYLDKYPRESDDKYKQRQAVAYYDSIFKQKVQRYCGYLYKKAVGRATKNKLIELILKDADNRGNSIDVFMSSFAHEAKVRGSMLLLVDMPKEVPPTLKDQIDQRAVPYFVPIASERVTRYKLDKFGAFAWIEFTDVLDESTPTEEKKQNITRYYDANVWIVKDGDDVIDQGQHGLGVCPVLQFAENGTYPCIGEFTQIGQLAKRHYNLNSELDEILRSQTFSLLTIQATAPKDVEVNIGTDNAMAYGANMERPGFIAPPSAPADTYQKKIEAIEARIDAIAYDTTTGKGAESGISLEIKFQGLNGSLGNFAVRLQDIERRAFDVAFRYLGLPNDIEISYPTEFNIIDQDKELKTLDTIKALGYSIPTYEASKLMKVIDSDINLSSEQKATIMSEIEDGLKQS